MPTCPPQRGKLDEYIIDSQRTVEVEDVENPVISWRELLVRDILEEMSKDKGCQHDQPAAALIAVNRSLHVSLGLDGKLRTYESSLPSTCPTEYTTALSTALMMQLT